jgi:hypothetical protein
MLAHDENGLTETVDFDWDAVERSMGEIDEEKPGVRDVEATLKAMEKLLLWLWQYSPSKTEGLEIRAAIVCWVGLRFLRDKTLEDLANGLGKQHKQSIGRWHDHFKRTFPEIKTSHMR